jgi:hypothetical protein
MIGILDTIDINYIVSHIKDMSGTAYGTCFTKLFFSFFYQICSFETVFLKKLFFNFTHTHGKPGKSKNTGFSRLSLLNSLYQTFFLNSFSFTGEDVHRTETKKSLMI